MLMNKKIKKFVVYSAFVVLIPGLIGMLLGAPLSLIALLASIGINMPALTMVIAIIELAIWLLIADFLIKILLKKYVLS